MLRVGKEKAALTKVTKAWGILAAPGPPFSCFSPLSLSCSGGGIAAWIRFCLNRFSWVSDVWRLCLVGSVYLRGAVDNRPEPWTRLRCSEVSLEQSSGAPCRTAWGAREQHKSAYMVLSLVDANQWICSQPTLRVSGTCLGWHCWRLLRHCNALQAFQGRWHPEMSWTVLRLARVTNLQQPEITTGWARVLVQVCTLPLWN